MVSVIQLTFINLMKSDMKQETAVEWLQNEIWEHIKWKPQLEKRAIAIKFEKAKEMEKEQIEDAYVDGAIQFKDKTYKGMQEYYNETYGDK